MQSLLQGVRFTCLPSRRKMLWFQRVTAIFVHFSLVIAFWTLENQVFHIFTTYYFDKLRVLRLTNSIVLDIDWLNFFQPCFGFAFPLEYESSKQVQHKRNSQGSPQSTGLNSTKSLKSPQESEWNPPIPLLGTWKCLVPYALHITLWKWIISIAPDYKLPFQTQMGNNLKNGKVDSFRKRAIWVPSSGIK